jgi:hypothetical protein
MYFLDPGQIIGNRVKRGKIQDWLERCRILEHIHYFLKIKTLYFAF